MFLLFLQLLFGVRGEVLLAFSWGSDSGGSRFSEHCPLTITPQSPVPVLWTKLLIWLWGEGSTGRLGAHSGPVAFSLCDLGQINCSCFSFLIWKTENNDTCLTDCFQIIWGNKPCFLNSKTLSILRHTQFSGGKNHYIDCKSQVSGYQNVKKTEKSPNYSNWGNTINKSALPLGSLLIVDILCCGEAAICAQVSLLFPSAEQSEKELAF